MSKIILLIPEDTKVQVVSKQVSRSNNSSNLLTQQEELAMVKAIEEEALAIYMACRTHREILEHQQRLDELTEIFLMLQDE